MKKSFLILVCFSICLFTLCSCILIPTNYNKTVNNLKDNGYEVNEEIVNNVKNKIKSEFNIENVVVGTELNGHNYAVVIYCADSKVSAKVEKNIEEINDYVVSLANLMETTNIVKGRNNKIVYFGTNAGIKACE